MGTKEYCVPCKCSLLNSTPTKKVHYFYSERIPIKEDVTPSNSRPASAGSMRSSRTNKNNATNSSKTASSDSKITKKTVITKTRISPLKNKETGKTKLDSENLSQLKSELKTIKEQLFILTKNKTEALGITNELEIRYNNLLDTNKNQKREIDELKSRIQKLLTERDSYKNINGSMKDIMTTKSSLDQYEEKLNTLYNEFLDTSKVMEDSREKLCQCIKKKSREFRNMETSQKEMSRKAEEKSTEYTNLLEKFKKSKENENKFVQQNAELTDTVKNLKNKLYEATKELEKFRKETATNTKKNQEEINETRRKVTIELQLKTKEIEKLNSTIEQLKKAHLCKCDNEAPKNNTTEAQYQHLLHTHKHTLQKLNMYEEKNRKREEEMHVLQQHEYKLIGELVKLQGFAEKLTKIANEYNLSISRLKTINQEKESVIKCQKGELASKDKQIELLSKNEDRLKRRVVELQEDLVSMKISSTAVKKTNGANILCVEDCPIHLTKELQDLIAALYEEIDKSLAKNEQIQKLNREICCLHCALSSKEKELIYSRNELQILRQQFTMILKEKQGLADHIKRVPCRCMEVIREEYFENDYYEE